MHALAGLLVPLIIIVGVALLIWVIAERFSPDPLITKIVQIIVFLVVLVALLTKLLPLIGA